MNQRIFNIALLAGSLAIASNLPAQDNRDTKTRQPTLEDRVDQLEQNNQSLKGQIDQLRNDVVDLQDRVKSSEGGKQPLQGPPPAARSSESDRSSVSAKAPRENSTGEQSYDVFYQGLESSGHWFDDPTYGEVWQPGIASSDRNWRPYSDGRWAYTDRGWTWISNEEFGWATYHYGRWVRRGDIGWVWIPGRRWAPAWVSWRESNDHVGWAPLPPEVADDSRTEVGEWVDNYYDIGPAAYLFVKISDLSRPSYREVVLPPSKDTEFFSETRNVTNIAFDSDIVAVNGPRYEQIESEAKIPSYKLSYVTGNQGRFGIDAKGDQLEVMAPPATLQRNASSQPKIEKTLGQAQVDHGWQEVNKEKAAQLRQAAAQQAPVPANLPAKPVPPNSAVSSTENQPAQTANEQKPTNTPTPSQASSQDRTPAATQPTRTPETQASGSQKPPTQAATPEGRQSSGGEANTNPKRNQPPSSSPTPANARETRLRQPVESSSDSRQSTEQQGQKQQPSKQTNPSSEELKDRVHTTKRPSSDERSNVENWPPNDREKKTSDEPQKQMEFPKKQPGDDSANGGTSRPELKREEPTREEKPEKSQKQSDVEQKQREHTNPEKKGSEKKEQNREKKEQPSVE
jgi:hypothetical protein